MDQRYSNYIMKQMRQRFDLDETDGCLDGVEVKLAERYKVETIRHRGSRIYQIER